MTAADRKLLHEADEFAQGALTAAEELEDVGDALPLEAPFVRALRKSAKSLKASAGATADIVGYAVEAADEAPVSTSRRWRRVLDSPKGAPRRWSAVLRQTQDSDGRTLWWATLHRYPHQDDFGPFDSGEEAQAAMEAKVAEDGGSA